MTRQGRAQSSSRSREDVNPGIILPHRGQLVGCTVSDYLRLVPPFSLDSCQPPFWVFLGSPLPPSSVVDRVGQSESCLQAAEGCATATGPGRNDKDRERGNCEAATFQLSPHSPFANAFASRFCFLIDYHNTPTRTQKVLQCWFSYLLNHEDSIQTLKYSFDPQ